MTQDNRAFCFIICTNNSFYFDECVKYISGLEVPEGYRVELLGIEGAKSMTAGYNEGMQASTAKYKIYMHQDVFIVNRYFLYEILEIFHKDDSIGVIGMVGSRKLPMDFIMWNKGRVGKLVGATFLGDGEEAEQERMQHGYYPCEVVDGLLLITAYDIPWREDILDGWDFYDVSQCLEFKRKGYQVVVPDMDTPWVIHDDGIWNLSRYNHYRQIAMQEYGNDVKVSQENMDEVIKKEIRISQEIYQDISDHATELEAMIMRTIQQIDDILQLDANERCDRFLEFMHKEELLLGRKKNADLCCTTLYEEVTKLELKRGARPHICKYSSLKQMNLDYQKLLFLLRRIRYAELFAEDDVLEIISFLEEKQFSGYYMIMALQEGFLGTAEDRQCMTDFLAEYYGAKGENFFAEYFRSFFQNRENRFETYRATK